MTGNTEYVSDGTAEAGGLFTLRSHLARTRSGEF